MRTLMLSGHYSYYHFAVFLVGVCLCLYIDLRAHKGDEPVSTKSAIRWCIFWESLAWVFAGYIWMRHGSDDASLFMTGYWLEKSLSVDNLFVMMAIFSSFAVRDDYQHRVLFYGILGALILRMVFVAAGSTVIELFGPYALAGFGIFVLWSAWKMWQSMNSKNEAIEDYSHHWSVTYTSRFFPIHNKMDGHNFFVHVEENGKLIRKATPLFLCLVVVELSDVMFAFDSVPAVIAITRDPFLVYTSNIFAILGLRSMFFLLAAAKRYLCHLEKSVVIILVYIGIKMLLDVVADWHISPFFSLGVVVLLLAGGILSSFIWPDSAEEPALAGGPDAALAEEAETASPDKDAPETADIGKP